VLEERGLIEQLEDQSEEMKFSAVVQVEKRNLGKFKTFHTQANR